MAKILVDTKELLEIINRTQGLREEEYNQMLVDSIRERGYLIDEGTIELVEGVVTKGRCRIRAAYTCGVTMLPVDKLSLEEALTRYKQRSRLSRQTIATLSMNEDALIYAWNDAAILLIKIQEYFAFMSSAAPDNGVNYEILCRSLDEAVIELS